MGLLSPEHPPCPDGHGPMRLLPEMYGLPQFIRPGIIGGQMPTVTHTGKLFLVRLRVCDTCGSVSMTDFDKVL